MWADNVIKDVRKSIIMKPNIKFSNCDDDERLGEQSSRFCIR